MPARVTLRRRSRAAAAEEAVQQEEEEESVALLQASTEDEPRAEGVDEVMQEEGQQAAEETQEPTASTSSATKANFVLVMDNGQLALVPAGKAHTYRSLPKRGQRLEEDSGASTPNLKLKKSKNLLRDRSSPRIRVVPVKRGRGRPPKKRARSQLLEFEFEEEEEPEEQEEEGEAEEEEMEEEGADTPAEDTEAQGGEEGVDGDDDDLVPPPMQMNVYIQGKDYVLRNDELVLDSDENGEEKVDLNGNLLGEREYSFKTFTSPYRADKEVVYALSIDVARGAGFRDSLYFFRRNPLLIKLSCTDKEKVMLIEDGRLSGQLRTRNVTMLAVRNVFKLHGAKVIKDGKYIVDDYYEKEARESGKKEDQPAQPAEEESSVAPAPRAVERRRDADRDRDRARRRPDAFTFSTSDLQGNAIYTTFGDGGASPFERSKGWNARRVNLQRADIDEENWMMEMARSVRGMNHEILLSRNERLKAFARPYEGLEGPGRDGDQGLLDESNERGQKKDKSQGLPIGFFEPMTNMPHYSSATQSSWAALERVHERPLLNASGSASSATDGGMAILGNAKVGSQAWGLASIDQRVRLPPPAAKGVLIPAAASREEEG